MQWHDHSKDIPDGAHAIFSGSKYAWIRKNDDEIREMLLRSYAPTVGTVVHELAAKRIKYNMRVKPKDKDLLRFYLIDNGVPEEAFSVSFLFPNFAAYVNDAISYMMRPEQPLYFSKRSYGTADAIRFDEKKKLLRIHDLKTGTTPASLDQLAIYAAYFCLEYKVKPGDIAFEFRIYQNNDILIGTPTASDILPIMDQTIHANQIAERFFNEED